MDLGSEHTPDGVADVIEQLTGQEVSPFLSLPREIRDIIYGYLLLLDTPIGLELGLLPENGRRPTFKTHLGSFPPICRTSQGRNTTPQLLPDTLRQNLPLYRNH
ncbi:hypothetical protein V502_10029 [Pseudogymnoascus sp. VKM F-4520 (FW-2644)]|nr:hypothetical protein V502_10029 [Pseudogymnoascus sp. VKM F-4520 (FW-2644)]